MYPLSRSKLPIFDKNTSTKWLPSAHKWKRFYESELYYSKTHFLWKSRRVDYVIRRSGYKASETMFKHIIF